MTRRGVLAALAATVAAMTANIGGQARYVRPEPSALRFDLRAFRSYTFTLDGESVTLTPEEMLAAIRPEEGEQ